MKILCLVNLAAEVASGDTTVLLLRAALQRGHEVWITGVCDLSIDPADRILARACRAAAGPDGTLAQDAPQLIDVAAVDVLFLRTNPGRDPARRWAHEVALDLARMVQARGQLVLSNPVGLAAAASKLYLTVLPPQFRPDTLVTRDRQALLDFARAGDGRCVLKPLNGSHGRDVFLVHAGDLSNFNQIVEVLTRSGFAMAQRFIPEASQGDTRLLLLDGEPLRDGLHFAAVRRVPGALDFRSNVHAGGAPAPGELTPALQAIAHSIGPRLRQDGIFLAGLDIIGDKVVEVNVFSPGGIGDAERFTGADFTRPIIDALEQRVRQR